MKRRIASVRQSSVVHRLSGRAASQTSTTVAWAASRVSGGNGKDGVGLSARPDHDVPSRPLSTSTGSASHAPNGGSRRSRTRWPLGPAPGRPRTRRPEPPGEALSSTREAPSTSTSLPVPPVSNTRDLTIWSNRRSRGRGSLGSGPVDSGKPRTSDVQAAVVQGRGGKRGCGAGSLIDRTAPDRFRASHLGTRRGHSKEEHGMTTGIIIAIVVAVLVVIGWWPHDQRAAAGRDRSGSWSTRRDQAVEHHRARRRERPRPRGAADKAPQRERAEADCRKRARRCTSRVSRTTSCVRATRDADPGRSRPSLTRPTRPQGDFGGAPKLHRGPCGARPSLFRNRELEPASSAQIDMI